MTPVVENFEIKKNNFSKWLFGAFALLSVVALAISWNEDGNNKWIGGAGVLLFVSGWLLAIKHKIIVYQDGFDIQTLGKTRTVNWRDISRLSFDMVYHGHSVETKLEIQHSGRAEWLPVKQYKRKPMQRFFEVLNEQCSNATKNDHFIKQATDKMYWRNMAKML